ncbi:CHAT domain-containing protein [Candidatus Fermentibacteria bacterium]|nr:CHAT domain-containing protein [Candidatus Fermentibacteria bacterium]
MRQSSLRALILALSLLPSLGRAQSHASSSSDPPASTAALPDTLLPWQRALSESDQAYVDSLQVLIVELRGEARYADAIGPAEEALRIRQAAQGDDHWETADAARLLATLRHVAALEPDARARLAEADRADDEVRRLFAEGDCEATAAVIRRQLAIRREILGDDHLEVAITMDDLAVVQWTMGDFAGAEPLFRQSLLLNRRLLGASHPNLARAMNNLATVLSWQGNHEAAIGQCREALAMNRRLLGENHPHVITDLDNLGVYLGVTGDYTGAEASSREAVTRSRAVFGEQNPDLMEYLQNLALHLEHLHDHAGAEALSREALAMSLALCGASHPAVGEARFGLALQRAINGDYEEAERQYREALAIVQVSTPRSPFAVLNRVGLAEVLHLRGDYAAAETAWIAAAESFEVVRRQMSRGGFGRVKFMENWSPFERLAACQARNGKPRSAWEHHEAHLGRGLLDALNEQTSGRLIPEERDMRQAHLDTLAALDDQIGALAQSSDTSSASSARLDSLRGERERQQTAVSLLETDLAATYSNFPGEAVGLEDLQASLGEHQALLAWVDVAGDPHAADPNGEHWACVVRHRGEPQWVHLSGSGESGAWTASDDELPGVVEAELGESQRRGLGAGIEARRLLYGQRIAPVEGHLQGVRHLLVIPSGSMTRIPVDALTDAYTVSFTPSATFWVSLRHQRRNEGGGATLLAVGDPVLDDPTGEDPSRIEDETIACLRSAAYLPLPGTRVEVETIAGLFEDANAGSAPTVLLGSAAREQPLCAAAASGELEAFCYIHFATHAVMNDRVPMQSSLVLSREDLGDAVDRAARGEAVYDGVITAEQILRTWRLDADLVTLSACETALGREYRGEGCLGFSQALFVAGARSLLLSLWKVEDRATMLLMTRFYENMLGVHREPRTVGGRSFEAGVPLPKAEALREAKGWLRTLTTAEQQAMEPLSDRVAERGLVPVEEPAPASPEDQPYAHPHFWAAFILTGDPR